MLKRTWIILIMVAMSGCAGYSMHSMHDVEIRVLDFSSDMPIGNVELSVTYDYDSYGWFYFANTPASISGITDSTGRVVLSLADYRYRILMRIEGKGADLNKDLVRQGGKVTVPSKIPIFMVELRPR
jgi:hypothetical protein